MSSPALAWEERRRVTGDHAAALEVATWIKTLTGELPKPPPAEDDEA
jgi:hypothetical protein